MIAIKKDAMRYRDPETGKFVGVSLIGGDAPSGGTPIKIDNTLTQSGQAADAKAVGDRLNELNGANAAQDTRLSALENASGIVKVEPAEDDVPIVFFGSDLPQTKTNTVMPFKYVSKTKTVSGYVKAKAQGNSSMSYPKKNQTVNMYADEALVDSVKVDFKGWGAQKKHVYKANWIDLTHARNIVSAQLWGDVVKSRANYADLPELLRTSPNQGAIDGFPALVYANGVYQGRYTINIPKDAWMANMDKTLDTHCILCGENYVSGCFRAAANIDGSDWSDELHDTVPDAIKTRWNEVISFVMNSTDDEFVSGIGNYFYLDSLIDYYIFGVVSCGLDAFGKNQIYMTYDGQKWIASMYDMDSTWGLYWNGSKFVAADYPRTSYEDYVNTTGNLLYIRLEKLFYEQIQARWAELRDGALSYSNIMTRFERFIGIVPPHIVKEDYASTTGGGKFTGIPSQNTNHIQQIRAYVAARLPYADEWFASLTPEVQIPCTGITLDQTTLTFDGAGTQTITATVTPSNTTDTVVWSSDAPSIASVSNGVVTAKANGSATITATCGDYSATCAVSVSGIENGSGSAVVWSDTPEYKISNTGSVVSGANYVTQVPIAVPAFATIEMSNNGGSFNWFGVAQYKSDMTFITYSESGTSTNTYTVVLDGGTKYVRLSAFNNNDASNNNPAGQINVSISELVYGTNNTIYELAEPATFDGVSNYIDTGVQLCKTDADYTIMLSMSHSSAQSLNKKVFFCMRDSSSYPGIEFTASARGSGKYEFTVTNSKQIKSPADFNSETVSIRAVLRHDAASNRYHATFLYNGEISTDGATTNFVSIDNNLLLGCSEDTSGTKSNYWSGTIDRFIILSGLASDGDISAFFAN